LVFLTAALLILTVYLSYDAYLNDQRAKQERKDRTEKRETNADIHRFPSQRSNQALQPTASRRFDLLFMISFPFPVARRALARGG